MGDEKVLKGNRYDNNNDNKMLLCSAVPVRGSAQCALQTKSLLKDLEKLRHV